MIIPLYEIVEMETSEQEHFNKFWVVGVPQAVLSTDCEDNLRFDFEATFKEYEVQTFQYLKGLGRVLVTCLSREHAELAFERLRTVEFHGMTIHVEPVEPITIGPLRLDLPEKPKQFLISPPASPPVGWEPSREPPPILDPKLLMSSLAQHKGEPQQVVPGSAIIPSIVVTPYQNKEGEVECQEEGGVATSGSDIGFNRPVKISSLPATIVHTPRPPIND